MSIENENIDMSFSSDWSEILHAAKQKQDLTVPENYFQEMEACLLLHVNKSVEEDLDVPEEYFAFNEETIILKVADTKNEEDFFQKQQEAIFSRIKLEELRNDSDLVVPDGYFEKSKNEVLGNIEPSGKVISMRSRVLWYSGIAAALLTAGVFFFMPGRKQSETAAFAELIGKTEIEIDDIEYFASEDEIYDLYFAYEELAYSDTLDRDTTGISSPADQMKADELNVIPAGVPLDPKTGLPLKKAPGGVKPSGISDVPSWDEITNEDLLDYLLEEGGDDILNDL